MKKDIEIVLKKEGAQDITVKCPQKIKLPAWRVYTTLYAGLPPLSIKPADMKGLVVTLLAFIAIFISCTFFTVNTALGVIVLGAVLVFNIIYTKNYFFNFIKKKLAEGYTVDDEEQKKILQEAGLSAMGVASSSYASTAKPAPAEDVIGQIEKLAALKEKGILSDEEFAAQKNKLLGLQ